MRMNESARKLPVSEAARFVGLSKSTLDKLRISGGGPTYLQLGRRVLYDVADLEAWLTSKRRSSTSDNGYREGATLTRRLIMKK
jgi:excisionase family DNA binding protein